MSRTKTVLIFLTILALAGLSIYLNRDYLTEQPIQISYRVSPWLKDARRPRGRSSTDLGPPVVFSLDPHLRLTSLKVVIAAEIATNKYAHPLWELTTSSNSVLTGSFSYGERIRGLWPKVKGATPDPLAPGVMYRVLLTTDNKRSAEHDFTTTPHETPAVQPAK